MIYLPLEPGKPGGWFHREFPWIVYVETQDRDLTLYSGTLITMRHVLTFANIFGRANQADVRKHVKVVTDHPGNLGVKYFNHKENQSMIDFQRTKRKDLKLVLTKLKSIQNLQKMRIFSTLR